MQFKIHSNNQRKVTNLSTGITQCPKICILGHSNSQKKELYALFLVPEGELVFFAN